MLGKPHSRHPHPSEKNSARMSKKGGIIFGLGVIALLATVVFLAGMFIPAVNTRLDNLSYRMRSYYRKWIPHPEYLPTPGPTLAVAHQESSFEPNIPPVPILKKTTATTTPTPISPSVTQIPSQTATPIPTLTPTLTPIPVTLTPISEQVQLTDFTHQWQTWNNCGPATITMHMSYFGHEETQVEAARFLKPNRDDKNVNPHEMADFVRLSSDLQVLIRRGGTVETLKKFISNGFPVLLETWLVHDGDGLGHYRLITGYDEAKKQFITLDSLNGPTYPVSYEQLEKDWRVFNGLYLVVYPPEQAHLVQAIVGDDMDETVMYERLLSQAEAEIALNGKDAIAHFNRGEALFHLDQPKEAVKAFDQARQLGLHWRRLWYQFDPFEAYYAVGRYQDVIELAQATLKGSGGLEEAYYYQGLALYATDQEAEAEEAFRAALEYNSNFRLAKEALKWLKNE